MKKEEYKKLSYIAIPILIGLSTYLLNYSVLKFLFIKFPSLIQLTLGTGSFWLTQSATIKLLYVGLLAPFIEELIFRRGVLNWFIKRKQFAIGLVLSSLAFGFWHMLFGWGILKAVDMTIVGIVFGLVYQKYNFKGSLLAHYSTKLLSLIYMLILVPKGLV